MKYVQRIDGEGFTVIPGQVTRWACCDCGLVHDLAFVVENGEIGVAARRNNRATAARRRAVSKRATITQAQADAAVRRVLDTKKGRKP